MKHLFPSIAVVLLMVTQSTAALLANWSCQDNAATTVIVDSVIANHMNLSAGTTAGDRVTGPGGTYPYALHFAKGVSAGAGANDYGALALCTFSVWMKTTASDATAVICKYSNAQQIFTESTFTIFSVTVANSDHQVVGSLNLRDGNWHHLCWTYSDAANQVKGYIDGVQVGSNITENGAFVHGAYSPGINLPSLDTTMDVCGFKIYDTLEDPAALYAEKNTVASKVPQIIIARRFSQ